MVFKLKFQILDGLGLGTLTIDFGKNIAQLVFSRFFFFFLFNGFISKIENNNKIKKQIIYKSKYNIRPLRVSILYKVNINTFLNSFRRFINCPKKFIAVEIT